MATAAPHFSSELSVWHWNGRRLRKKRGSLIQYLQSHAPPPDIIFLQEPRTLPNLPGYVTHVAHNDPKQDHLVATLVKRVHTAVDFTLDNQAVPHVLLELLPASSRKRNTQPLRLLNVYSRPQDRYAWFDTLFEAARGKECATYIAGDFNAPHPTWGYPRDTPKGRKLHTLIQQHNLTLLSDPSTPTRLGTSVARDTCPDLTLYRGTKPGTWHNLEEQLGSDHSILVTHINTTDFEGEARKIRITEWPAFRASSSSTLPDTLTDWVQTLQTRLDRHTCTLTTTPDSPDINSHLLHLWEARRGLTKRWRRQRHNRKLKLRIAQLTVDAATYAANLTGQNWNTLCDKLNGTLGTARTWSLLRHLIQPGQAKSERAKGIYKLLHATNLTDSECLTQLRQRYLPPPDTPRYADYTGPSNNLPYLNAPITDIEIRAALTDIRRNTSPGPDKIRYSLLYNLSYSDTTQLTMYLNEVWES
ncbi:hypothetical protein ISCGN_006480, partial [Ixodes scapularis]